VVLSVEANTSLKRTAVLTVSGCYSSEQILIAQESNPLAVTGIQPGQFRIFPIPTERYVHIEFPAYSGTYSAEVITSTGQKILNRRQINSGEILDMKGFSKGIYYLNIYSNTLLKTEKIVVW
jgi:hypothetical protein